MKYSLDANKAKASEVAASTRITETGAYKGKFVLAEKIIANSGTEGIEFTFQADDGSTANWLRLYTVKADGTETFGYGMLMSLMTCLKILAIASENVTVEKWDKNANAKLPVDIENFSSLCNKPIGVILQKELKDFDKFNMNIVGFYEAATGLTATDILEKRAAGALDKKIATLKDKDSRSSDDTFSSPAPVSKSDDPFGADAGDLSGLPF